jgi:glycosyltransferase involved in cell wall biosynthesis
VLHSWLLAPAPLGPSTCVVSNGARQDAGAPREERIALAPVDVCRGSQGRTGVIPGTLRIEKALMKKVVLLNNIPSPYLTPLFNQLARAREGALEVWYISAWSSNVGWAPDQVEDFRNEHSQVLDERFPALRRRAPQFAATLAMLVRLLSAPPEYVLIYGYTRLPQVTALWWCWLCNVPFAIAGDATYYADGAMGLRKWLKERWLGFLSSRAAAILVVGKASRMFWEAYGAASSKIYAAPFAVDNEFFQAESRRRQPEALAYRARQGWQTKTVFLYAGRLIKRKHVDVLIRAVQQLDPARAQLLIVGAGEERAALEALASGDARIRFVGGASQQELAFYYALSDVLVLPAREEPWGLVINEAMVCGLAQIAHWQCGAAVDLVDADNGILLRSFAVEELVAAMNSLVADPAKLHAMQQRSQAKIAPWSFAEAAASIQRALTVSAALRHSAIEPAIVKERSEKTQ